jgi:hypothetical protein
LPASDNAIIQFSELAHPDSDPHRDLRAGCLLFSGQAIPHQIDPQGTSLLQQPVNKRTAQSTPTGGPCRNAASPMPLRERPVWLDRRDREPGPCGCGTGELATRKAVLHTVFHHRERRHGHTHCNRRRGTSSRCRGPYNPAQVHRVLQHADT